MSMWRDHLQLDLQLKCVITYDKELKMYTCDKKNSIGLG